MNHIVRTVKASYLSMIFGILVLVILASCNKTGTVTGTAPAGLTDLTVTEASTTLDSVELTLSQPTDFGTTDGTTAALFGSYAVKVYYGVDDSGTEVDDLTLTPSSLDESTTSVKVSGLISGTQHAFKLVLSNDNDPFLSSDSNVVSTATTQGPGGRVWNKVSASDDRFSGRSGHAAVAFDNKLWVIGGYDGTYYNVTDYKENSESYRSLYLNDVWSSSNGESWTKHTTTARFSRRSGHAAVVFDDKIWVIGGYDGSNNTNDVWSSSDGESWTEETKDITTPRFSARSNHAAVVFDDKIWVIGGTDVIDYNDVAYSNDVWSSSDGKSWTEETKDVTTPRFSGRYHHEAVVSGGKLWVIGGYDGARLNDVWSSPDGKGWTEETKGITTPRFSGRENYAAAVFDGKLWVIGGYDGTRLNDVWSSPDGKSWTEVVAKGAATTTKFSGRYSHAVAVFDNKLWVISGIVRLTARLSLYSDFTISTVHTNDVWHSP